MNKFPKTFLSFLLIIYSFIKIHAISAATDTLNTSTTITDGATLVSCDGKFELGFFSPGNSSNRYLGIWFKNISVRTYVWVANRKFPLTSKSGVLRVTEPGFLALYTDTNGTVVWSSITTKRPVSNPVAQLLDTGNLVVKDAEDTARSENIIWQSFDHPSDVLIPGMGLGRNFVTGVDAYLSAWRSRDDPAPGEFAVHLDPTGSPQLVLYSGSTIHYRLGQWNGLRFSGVPSISTISLGRMDGTVKTNADEVKYREFPEDNSFLTTAIVTSDGFVQRWTWNYGTQNWDIFTDMLSDECDKYNLCGVNGVCSIRRNSPSCGCLDRFVPRDSASSRRGDWSNGCMRRMELNCEDDVFVKYSGMKLPDARNSTADHRRMRLSECEAECSRNCSCTAYTQLDIREEVSGCLFYYGELIDIKTLAEDGQDIYIRMAAAELGTEGRKRAVIIIGSVTPVAAIILVCLTLLWIYYRKRKNGSSMINEGPFIGSNGEEAELPFFTFSTIKKATDHFSDSNKLGEGGFGPVYKGVLEGGLEIAVKRLSKNSSQGFDELRNEVILIAKLQHRNLVKLLGCCIERMEKMLIYEYMPNSSLDLILFDETKRMSLDWAKRFHIIKGIAKGLLYLHHDSRLRIIHRDLKASNILLDSDMNPKISDFGLARSFGGNEIEAETRRVVGTFGYMSPEYTTEGRFSIKSDVFSFGVLVIEVVSGKRNNPNHYYDDDDNSTLLGHAWTLYKKGKSIELVDASLGNSFDSSEVLRAIHVGLLCVQKCPEDRPSMSSVICMLGNEAEVPQAKQPGFFPQADIQIAATSLNQYSLPISSESIGNINIEVVVV